MFPIIRRADLCLCAMLMLAVAGCGSQKAIPTYDLVLSYSPPPRLPQGRGLLIIAEPLALQPLDTDRILIKPSGTQITYLSDAQWSDRLPRLVQTKLVQAFENAHRLKQVGRPGDRLNADYQLVTELRAFGLSVSNAPVAEIEISAKLVSERTGKIIAARIFRSEVPAASARGHDATFALNEAAVSIFDQIISWSAGKV